MYKHKYINAYVCIYHQMPFTVGLSDSHYKVLWTYDKHQNIWTYQPNELIWNYDPNDQWEDIQHQLENIHSTDEVRIYHIDIYDIRSVVIVGKGAAYDPPNIDLTIFPNIQNIEIEEMHIHWLTLPDTVYTITIDTCRIEHFTFPSNVVELKLKRSPGFYNRIQTFPTNMLYLTLLEDDIPELYLPDNVDLVQICYCTIGKITNVLHHIHKYTTISKQIATQQYPLTSLLFKNNIWPYKIRSISHEECTNLPRLQIIHYTNLEREAFENATVAVRLRNNVFIQETHCVAPTHNAPDRSCIYNVMRLGANYPRRWIEFILPTLGEC